uniref:Uncharacterized protein n=1 Tax=Anopheles albimanus TaxID=7167 RepID=A0A182FEK5_ANOAL
MSIVPIFFRNWWEDEWDRPLRSSRLLDQHFGSGIGGDDLLGALAAVTEPRHRRHPLNHHHHHHHHGSGRYVRPWHSSCVANTRDSGSTVNVTKQIVCHFTTSCVANTRDSGSTVNVTNDKFQINLDVQQFAPEEISVKYVDKCLVVEGKHEEKEDEHGYISRHFVRRYMLPAGHNENQIESSLSSDGILTVTCPRLAIEKKPEKSIPITHTGKPSKMAVDQQPNGAQSQETKGK